MLELLNIVPAKILLRIEFIGPESTLFGTPCWVVVRGHMSRNGYGRVSFGGRDVQIHRYIYELLREKIPHGMILDHLCRVRACCNPFHCEPVSHAENTRRGKAVLYRRPCQEKGKEGVLEGPSPSGHSIWTSDSGVTFR